MLFPTRSGRGMEHGRIVGACRLQSCGWRGLFWLPTGIGDVPKTAAPLLLHYASLDECINAGIAEFEAELKAAGKMYELHMYEGANHTFNNDTSEARYSKPAADLAWGRTVEFLKKNTA